MGADKPGLYIGETVAVTGWPTGAFADTTVQAQTPVWRSDSVLFQDSFLGGGMRMGVSPAFVEVGPSILFKPIAIMDLKVEATHTSYFIERFGLLGYEQPGGELSKLQKAAFDDGDRFTGESWTALVQPTFYIQVGPIVGMSSWTYSWIRVKRPAAEPDPYVFEVYRGIVMEWEDLVIQHFSAVLYQALDGKDRHMLRFGVLTRGKWAKRSPDQSLTLGGVIMAKPGIKPSVPTLVGIIAPYVQDTDYIGKGPVFGFLSTDYVGRGPWVAVVSTWDIDVPFKR